MNAIQIISMTYLRRLKMSEIVITILVSCQPNSIEKGRKKKAYQSCMLLIITMYSKSALHFQKEVYSGNSI